MINGHAPRSGPCCVRPVVLVADVAVGLLVPRTPSRHATWTYSCRRPPSRFAGPLELYAEEIDPRSGQRG